MKTYGHLRDQHSANMAQKVTFVEAEPEIVPQPSAEAATPNVHAGLKDELMERVAKATLDEITAKIRAKAAAQPSAAQTAPQTDT